MYECVHLANGATIPVYIGAYDKYYGAAANHGIPVSVGYVGPQKVEILKDTGCSTAIVKERLVRPEQMTGERHLCILVDGTTRKFPVAVVEVDTPYYVGQIEVVCMKKPLFDLIIGNVPKVKDTPDSKWIAPQCRVQLDTTPKSVVQRTEKHHDKKEVHGSKFKVGDKVLVLLPEDHRGLTFKWKGPFKVTEVVSNMDYKVKVGGASKFYHASQLKQCSQGEASNMVDKSARPPNTAFAAGLRVIGQVPRDVPNHGRRRKKRHTENVYSDRHAEATFEKRRGGDNRQAGRNKGTFHRHTLGGDYQPRVDYKCFVSGGRSRRGFSKWDGESKCDIHRGRALQDAPQYGNGNHPRAKRRGKPWGSTTPQVTSAGGPTVTGSVGSCSSSVTAQMCMPKHKTSGYF